MGWLAILPKVERCCFCTRNLKAATVFIIMWSVLVTCHGISIVISPYCVDLYAGKIGLTLVVFKWLIFTFNLVFLVSSFAFLFGIFWNMPIIGDVFIICGIISATLSLTYAIMYITKWFSVQWNCNPSDPIVLIVYFGLWCYFIIVVSSYVESI